MNIHMKTGSSIVRSVLAAAAALVMGDVMADTTVSEYRNAFSTAEVFTFDQLVSGNTYLWCGCTDSTFDENWCTWESVDGTTSYGIDQTGDYFRTADASSQKARLRIGSGSYTVPYMYLGANGGTSYVVVTGGVLRATTGDIHVGYKGGTSTLVISNGTVSCAYWLTAGRDAATTSRIEVHGGTLTTAYRDGAEQTGNTGNGMIDLASYAGSTATFLQTGGRVHAAGSSNKGDMYIAMSVGNASGAEASVEMTGGEMDIDGVLQVPRAGSGTFCMNGGTLEVLDFVQIGVGENSTGAFVMSNGTASINRYITMGFASGSTGTLQVDGGTLNVNGNTEGIGFLVGDNVSAAKSEMTVSGSGVVNGYADCYVGWKSAGKLTIKDNGYVCVGTSSAHKWFKLNNYSDVTGHSEINLDGGTLDVCHIRLLNAGDGSADVNFNGGKINVYANNSHAGGNVFGNDSSGALKVCIKENGGTISVPSGVGVAVNAPLLTGVTEGTDGGFTKDGDGTLTLYAGANTYNGSTVVRAGTLALASGGTLASSSLELAGGDFTGASFSTMTISSGDYTFSELPTNTSGTVTLTGGTLRMTAAEAQATENTATVVVNGGTLIVDGSTESSLAEGSTLTFSNVTLGTGVTAGDVVKVTGVQFDWTYGTSDSHPTATAATASGNNVWIGGDEGYWKENVNWTYGVPETDGTAYINNDTTILFDANKTVASIVVNASVMFKTTNTGSVHPTVYIHDVTGTGTIRLYHVGFEGNGGDYRIGTSSENTLTLEFVSTETDSWLKNVNVYAPITGAGYLRIYEGTKFYGDNSGLTGTVQKDDVDARFMTPQSGFSNASTVKIYGTLWLWFTEGEISFSGDFEAWSSGNCGINLPEGVTDVTLTLGGGNGNVILSRGWDKSHGWYNYYSAFVDSNGWQQGTDKFTLRKIGTGAISEFGIESVYNLSLEGGSVNLGAEKVYTGADTRLTVTNATLGIAAATTLATADFKSDSTLQSTYYDGGAYLLTVTGAATMNGATLTAVGTTPSTNTTYTVLTAASVSGSAESGIADPDDTDKKVWKVKFDSSNVKTKYEESVPGFFLILR